MRVLIVDDEPAMLWAMERLLSKMEGVEIIGSFRSAAEALDFARNREADLAFLDIRIAADDGLELARRLRSEHPDLDIVFTTSHADFAIDAYDVYPLDYMVKPISSIRLEQTIGRAARRRRRDASEEVGALAAGRLRIRGLGCLEAVRADGSKVKWISRKSMELFAHLLVHRGRSVSKARIVEDIFPDMPVKNAETYLHTAVYQLRKSLSLLGYKEMVISAQEQYRLNLDLAEVDFIQFEQGVEGLPEINADNESAAMELEKQFVGELFEDKSYVWAAADRERLAALYNSFAKRLARWLLVEKRFADAGQVMRKVVSRNEFEEESHLLLFTILGAMGDQLSLQHYYERYSRLLLQELGLQPSPAVRRLFEQASATR